MMTKKTLTCGDDINVIESFHSLSSEKKLTIYCIFVSSGEYVQKGISGMPEWSLFQLISSVSAEWQ
jgi:hypothetical protein